MPDYYQTLGVSRDASDADIKKAYRALVKEAHPDSGSPGDVARFHAIREAYEVLSDPIRRRAYDGPPPTSWTGGFEEPLTPFREVYPRARRDAVHLDIVMTEDEAHLGADIVVESPREDTCERCAGKGLDFFGWCEACRGDGFVETRERIRFRVRAGAHHGDVVQGRTSDGRVLRARVRLR